MTSVFTDPIDAMTTAAPNARRHPQLALDLGPDPPLPAPPHEELVAAALANEFVRDFIAESVPTWSDEKVARNPRAPSSTSTGRWSVRYWISPR